MSQITSGMRAALSSPVIYNIFQNIMGARKVRQELLDEFIRPEAGSRILDLGCGTAEILKFLPDTVEYWGYDINPEYIASAKAEYGTRGNFNSGLLDKSATADLPEFDLVLALGVLHHLDSDEARAFFSLAKHVLRENGRMITVDPCLVENQNPVARYLIMKDRGQNVRDANQYSSLATGAFLQTKGTLRHRKWIPYTHWIMECRK